MWIIGIVLLSIVLIISLGYIGIYETNIKDTTKLSVYETVAIIEEKIQNKTMLLHK